MTQRGWYETEEEYYLLLFSVAVCGLRFISFSLDHCWCPLDGGAVDQLCWLLSYTFYHPFFYNGPLVTHRDYVEQVRELTEAAPELNCDLVPIASFGTTKSQQCGIYRRILNFEIL